jgi:hypothetical protein
MWLFVKQSANVRAVFSGFLQCRRPAWLQALQRKRRGDGVGIADGGAGGGGCGYANAEGNAESIFG